jgi:glyoxylase-like metal-dependent hydrolase (beta-lactamase superfamily II)
MKKLLIIVLVLTGTLSLSLTSHSTVETSKPKAEDNFTVVKVAEGVYGAIAKSGGLASGNAGFIIGDDGVIVFDTFFTPTAIKELIDVIGADTKSPIKYAINSHYHLDHTGGNQVFAERGIPIIGHEKLLEWQTTKNRRFLPEKAELEKRHADAVKQLNEAPPDATEKRAQLERQIRRLDEMANITLTKPTETLRSGTRKLRLGKRTVVLFTMPGHTGGDLLAYIPDANVLFMGDMGWRKTLPNLVDANVGEWVTSLDKLLKQYPTAKFVPGHGEVATAEEIREFRDYLADLKMRVSKAIAGGLTLEQAKQKLTLPDKYSAFGFKNFATPNVEDMYKELMGTKN